ncbi:MAG TPA: hypothetical protein VJJ02_01450 [Candidatus Paceibacterota bacterium]
MRIRVDGWSNSREVLVRDGKVHFEVGMDHNHCATCASRIRHIERALSAKDTLHRFEGGGGSSLFVVLDAPPKGVELTGYLERALDITVR